MALGVRPAIVHSAVVARRVLPRHPQAAWTLFVVLLVAALSVYFRWLLHDAVEQLPTNLDGGLNVIESDVAKWQAVRQAQAMMLARLFVEPSASGTVTRAQSDRHATFLQAVADADGYDGIWVFDETGQLLAQASGAGVAGSSPTEEPIGRDTVMLQTAVTDALPNGAPALDFIAAAVNPARGTGQPGVRIVLRSRPSDTTFRNLNPTSAINHTARTSLLVQVGDSVFVVATRSHQRTTSLPRAFAFRSVPPHVRRALQGTRALGVGPGLYGARVAFAARPTLAPGWALVREMEAAEYEDRLRTPVAMQATIFGALALLLAFAITNRARAAAARRARQLARMQTEFVARASHELRTPLTQIRLFSELLRAGGLSGAADTDRALSVITSESQRMSALVDNLLNFASLRRVVEESEVGRSDIAIETAQVLVDFAVTAGQQHVRLSSDLQSPTYAHVRADAYRQVLINFLDNALKYGPRGQTIRVRVWQTARAACLSVEDEGPGVPPAQRDRVWQAFYRDDSAAAASTPGSGIGLAVVRDLVMQCGGTVRIEHGECCGARFVAEFPAPGLTNGPTAN